MAMSDDVVGPAMAGRSMEAIENMGHRVNLAKGLDLRPIGSVGFRVPTGFVDDQTVHADNTGPAMSFMMGKQSGSERKTPGLNRKSQRGTTAGSLVKDDDDSGVLGVVERQLQWCSDDPALTKVLWFMRLNRRGRPVFVAGGSSGVTAGSLVDQRLQQTLSNVGDGVRKGSPEKSWSSSTIEASGDLSALRCNDRSTVYSSGVRCIIACGSFYVLAEGIYTGVHMHGHRGWRLRMEFHCFRHPLRMLGSL
ncbi:hypothetical protein NE237_005492 [Protea cynaroides]|uniref:Uncharacterized protein n=1 Tax=Protea cynaroides TaxID=273540 RepID=A0A9Q0KKL0_9MAGN|nr:hypothetical protein NE237_005492 [Protea cynaroides]